MVGSEANPFAKSGGLGDVLGALPQALVRAGHEVCVLLPRYGSVALEQLEEIYPQLVVPLGGVDYYCSLWQTISGGVRYLFLDRRDLYDRWGGLYGVGNGSFPDNHLRFALLSKAALVVRKNIFFADVIHAHDWQGGLVGPYLQQFRLDPGLLGTRTVFTIHNLGYQGMFHNSVMPAIGLERRFYDDGTMRYYDAVNFMKGGIEYSDRLTTVSPRYAQEIQTPEYGFGLHGLLWHHRQKLSGILNGVDYSEWNPETDRYLPVTYSAESLEGKRECKKALLAELGFEEFGLDRPLLGVVSRLAEQKGLDLVAQAARDLIQMGCGLVILGSGDPALETYFRALEWNNRHSVRAWIGYSNRLAHLIEAGSDMFLMPSRYEPCGLNQIYSLRYGTVPVVRATGGLDDTINGENGFKFWGLTRGELVEAVRVALAEYGNPEAWQQRMRNGMAANYSWDVAAAQYGALYAELG